MPKLARPAAIVLPILRAALDPSVTVATWVANLDYRTFPIVNIRRIGGTRSRDLPTQLSHPIIEMTVYGTVDLATTENLYEDALEALYDAVWRQTTTDYGSLSSIKETMGATQFDSPFQDSWRVQGLIQLGIRPLRIQS
jgi:hypothetical protein